MGGGIAAHLANLGIKVFLAGISLEEASLGIERIKRSSPPALYDQKSTQFITPTFIEEADAFVPVVDWVCEAILEKFDAKVSLYQRIEHLLAPTTMISTNTSGLEITRLSAGMSSEFRSKFMGVHFFNPPRYLKLVELIPGHDTATEQIQRMSWLLENQLGKRVIVAKDTPGFIANRFGMWSMYNAIHTAEKLGMTIEEVDAISGPFIGRPKSASFRLCDVVGIDIMDDIAKNLLDRCPQDPFIGSLESPISLQFLIEKGWLGSKTGQGYYRKEAKGLLALDLTTNAYRDLREPRFNTHLELATLPLGQRVREAIEKKDEAGTFLRVHLLNALRYADYLRSEVSHNFQDFDRVMKWGFGWKFGPFEMIDEIGADFVGITGGLFYRPDEMRSFEGPWIARKYEPEYRTIQDYPILESLETVNLRELGDGVSAICITTKMGVINPQVISDVEKLLIMGLNRFVFTSEGKAFSAGYDLNAFQAAIDVGDYAIVDSQLLALQQLGEMLENRHAVAAVFDYCLGAGLELALSCGKIVALAESKIGLPETRVGLLPGGRGCTLMRLHNQSSAKSLVDAALLLTQGQITNSAVEAKNTGFLRSTDQVEFHPDRLIELAKKSVLNSEPAKRPDYEVMEGPLNGMIDRGLASLKQSGDLTDYDCSIGDKIKAIFAKSTGYDDSLSRERTDFVDLCRNNFTQTRIRYMLETGKPFKN